MKYDFESVIERKGHDALAFDQFGKEGFGPNCQCDKTEIAMWIADMNFATSPKVVEEIANRVAHPIYGYFDYSDEYYNSIISWQKERNQVEVKKENIGYENGVLGGVASALRVLCTNGDSILIHSPTYVGFTSVLKNAGYNIVLSELVIDDNGIWRMNFEDMEKKIIENKIHATIFCSPHNPTGRVWEKWEIEKAMEIFKKHDVMVVSDEIWSDIILFNNKHIPTQSISEDAKQRTVALYAPSKTFNLAGLIGSYHIIYNNYIKERIDREEKNCHYNHMNVLSMHGLIGAYKSYDWLEELKQVLSKNIDYGYNFICNNFPNVKVQKPQGTYMLYLDCTDYCLKHNCSIEELLQLGYNLNVAWQNGEPFNRKYTIRMNLSSPYSVIVDAFNRLATFLKD